MIRVSGEILAIAGDELALVRHGDRLIALSESGDEDLVSDGFEAYSISPRGSGLLVLRENRVFIWAPGDEEPVEVATLESVGPTDLVWTSDEGSAGLVLVGAAGARELVAVRRGGSPTRIADGVEAAESIGFASLPTVIHLSDAAGETVNRWDGELRELVRGSKVEVFIDRQRRAMAALVTPVDGPPAIYAGTW